MQIVTFKLQTGQQVVGELVNTKKSSSLLLEQGSETEEVSFKDLVLKEVSFVLAQPLAVQLVPNGPNSYNLALAPYDPTNPEGKVEFMTSKVMSIAETSKGLEQAYMQQTTGIQISQAMPSA